MIQPGEIYIADLYEAGRRPVVVVPREELNRGNYVVVVAVTSARFATRRLLANCVPFNAGEFGLSMDCVAQRENVFSVEKSLLDLENGPIGTLDESRMRSVVHALGHVMEADCEPV